MPSFTLAPDRITTRYNGRILRGDFPDPLIQTRAVPPTSLIDKLQTWTLEWDLMDSTELENLKQAFNDTRGGGECFTWLDPPDGAAPLEVRFAEPVLTYTMKTKHRFAARTVLERFIRPVASDVT